VAALLTYGQKLPRGQGLHTVSSAEQEVKSTEEFKKEPAGQLQLTLVLMAQKVKDPPYKVPSGPSTGDEPTPPSVVKFHLRLPAEVMA
jgi:hypothetical protein